MQKAVKDGRWEVVGGTMVELDCNLPDAESHARQILYGKRYFREKFGKDVKIGWCPDSFGYNGNLPQLLKKGGIDYFVTSKITWNDTNKFPHHLFWWESPDGSRVLAFLPFAGYTFNVDGEKIVEHLAEFEKEVDRKEVMFIYGVGNHGGGPTREEIRRAEKLKKLEWFPKVKTAPAADFFARVSEEERAKLPTWKSELYLEYHRGTYTSQAGEQEGEPQGRGEADARPRSSRCSRGSASAGCSTRRRSSARPGTTCCSTRCTTSCRGRASRRSTATPPRTTRRCSRSSTGSSSGRWRRSRAS